ncbi:hypothetical protein NM688_g154 [Phlebia brevispora]|uniref:Uncharacterized protein n=1 Tax=Phlebia brevispora TaxID=194682 RepID=A0ACC1TFW2_9APHY|nr:hypothetical protein NM688_g154 [Phlebia brevispora]
MLFAVFMKPISLLTLLSAATIPTVLSAPPGIEWWETLASTSGCLGTDLFSIGWNGQPGTSCISLADGAATDYSLAYYLWSTCTINLYSEAGCADDTLVLNIPEPASGSNIPMKCINVTEGFRALQVLCDVEDL